MVIISSADKTHPLLLIYNLIIVYYSYLLFIAVFIGNPLRVLRVSALYFLVKCQTVIDPFQFAHIIGGEYKDFADGNENSTWNQLMSVRREGSL
jgi:hypothetical protein